MEIESSILKTAGEAFLGALGIGSDPVASAERAAHDREDVGPQPFWKIIARVEGDESDFPKKERLSADHLRDMVETFDPDRRRVPWISGFIKGAQSEPSHWSSNPPVAEVRALSFDGRNLWAQSLPRVDPDTGEDLFRAGVERGLTERSIGYDLDSNETGGAAMLLHIAQMSQAEQPGISNMPRLDRASETSPTARYRTWSRTGGEERDLMAAELSEESLEAFREMTDSAIVAGVAPIVERLDGIESRVTAVEELTSTSEEDEKAAAKETEEQEAAAEEEERTRVRTLVQGYVDESVQSGRARGHVEAILRAFPADLSAEQAEQIRVALNGITPLDREGSPILHEVRAADDTSVRLPENAFRVLGTKARPDPEQERLLGEAWAEAQNPDGTVSLSALRDQIYRRVGERLPARGIFNGRLRS